MGWYTVPPAQTHTHEQIKVRAFWYLTIINFEISSEKEATFTDSRKLTKTQRDYLNLITKKIMFCYGVP